MMVVPTDNPGRCSRCHKAKNNDGKPKEIHWSIRAQAWLCLWCHFDAPDAAVERP